MKFTQYVQDYLAKNPDSGLTYREAMKDDGVRCAYKQHEADMCKQGYVRETEKRTAPKRKYKTKSPVVETVNNFYGDASVTEIPAKAPKPASIGYPAPPRTAPREIKQAPSVPVENAFFQQNPLIAQAAMENLQKYMEEKKRREVIPQPVPPAPVAPPPQPIVQPQPIINVQPPNVNVSPAPVTVNQPPTDLRPLIQAFERWESRQLRGFNDPLPPAVKQIENNPTLWENFSSWLSQKRDSYTTPVQPRQIVEEEEEIGDDEFFDPLDSPEEPQQQRVVPSTLPQVSGQQTPQRRTISNVQTPQYRMPEQYQGVIPTSVGRTPTFYRQDADEGFSNALYGRSPVLGMTNAQLAQKKKEREAAQLRAIADKFEKEADEVEQTGTVSTDMSNLGVGRTSTKNIIAAAERKAKKDAEAEARREREREEEESKRREQPEQARYDTERNIQLLSKDLGDPPPPDREDHKQTDIVLSFKKRQRDKRNEKLKSIKTQRQREIERKRLEKTDDEVASIYSSLLSKKDFIENALKFDRGNAQKKEELQKTDDAIRKLNIAPTRAIADAYAKEFRIEPSESDATTIESGTPVMGRMRGVTMPMSDAKRTRVSDPAVRNLGTAFSEARGMGIDDKKEKLKHILHALIDVSL